MTPKLTKTVYTFCHTREHGFRLDLSCTNDPDRVDTDRGPYLWNIYAYIYLNHPLFGLIAPNGDIHQPIFDLLPFHWGVTYFAPQLRLDGDKVRIASFQIGNDYNHLHDQMYTLLGPHPTEVPAVFIPHITRLINELTNTKA